jgi:hypothetical protein
MEDTPEVSVLVYAQDGTPTGITSLEITDSTEPGRALLTAASVTEQRTDLGLGTAALANTGDFAATSHTHIISNVTGLQTALDGKAATSHTHIISNVTGLQTALDGKAALVHSHIIADTTGLQTALDGKVGIPASSAQGDILYRDGTGWVRLAAGTSGQLLRTNGAGANPSWGVGANIVVGSTIATTSGNIQDFTGIPAGVRRVHLIFDAVSTNGIQSVLVQLGTSGGVETTGYFGGFSALTNAAAVLGVNGFAGFPIVGNTAGFSRFGRLTLTTIGVNRWIGEAVIGTDGVLATQVMGGVKAISGTLDRLRLGIVGGTEQFDQGSVTPMWEF